MADNEGSTPQLPDKNKLIMTCAVVVLGMLCFFVIVAAFGIIGYLTGNMFGGQGGGQTGGLCNVVPQKYQSIFLGAARGDIPPALLAAFFAQEHGRPLEYKSGYTPTSDAYDPWPEQNGDPNAITKWQDGPPTKYGTAHGPMQFLDSTWAQYGGGGDIQNISDAALATARMAQANFDSQSGTTEERLKKVIYLYNHDNNYVDQVWAKYQKFNCGTGGQVLAGRMDVPFIDQRVSEWCGRASQAMVIAFFDRTNLAKYDTYDFLNANQLNETTVQNYTKRNYRWGNPSLDAVINSLKNGYPAIVYTNIYGKHIFVLTGFDGTRFWANDTFGDPTTHKDIQKLGGVELTKENLQSHLMPQGGHTFLYVP